MPTITLDQPLYAITKRIQWTWPEQYGEDQFIVILGGLHIEMAAIKVLGDWLDDSGWVEALVQAGVASAATADSFIKAARVTRTRHAHQVTASSLYTLLKKAYAKEKTVEMENELLKFVRWCNERCSESTMFFFWYTTLQIELILLMCVRSLRESSFPLNVDAIMALISWFFALDHVNYAR